jgi:hypothetical protein
MQKTGRIARNEILSVFNKLNMTFLSSHSSSKRVSLIRIAGGFGSTPKDDRNRLNSLNTALVFSYFAA